MQKIYSIILNALPIILMVGLIPFIKDDYLLSLVYAILIVVLFFIKYEKNDLYIFVFGFLIMILSEYLFISTGVEVFLRNSLFGVMPLWLPFLWGYGFVAIKRSVKILDSF